MKHASQYALFISCISQISSKLDEEFCLASAWGMMAIALSVRPYEVHWACRKNSVPEHRDLAAVVSGRCLFRILTGTRNVLIERVSNSSWVPPDK